MYNTTLITMWYNNLAQIFPQFENQGRSKKAYILLDTENSCRIWSSHPGHIRSELNGNFLLLYIHFPYEWYYGFPQNCKVISSLFMFSNIWGKDLHQDPHNISLTRRRPPTLRPLAPVNQRPVYIIFNSVSAPLRCGRVPSTLIPTKRPPVRF